MIEDARTGLIVVAHPDDESLWFAGLPIRFPDVDWTIVCCSIPRKDPERAWKFFDACELLGARPRVLPFIERGSDRTSVLGLDLLELDRVDLLATHNRVGEYGHPQHRAVHGYLRTAWGGRPLVTPGYGSGDGELVVGLRDEERARKLAAILAYDHTVPGTKGTKGERLLARYGEEFDLWRETYHVA